MLIAIGRVVTYTAPVSSKNKSLASILFAVVLSTVGCVNESAPPIPDPVDTNAHADLAGLPNPCSLCTTGQVCVEGRCQDIPKSCPCPKESYCDLATSTCKAGCTDDSLCSTGRICETDTRTCRAGCRMDDQCARGSICDATMCRTGCRGDTQCSMGEICESTKCRAGCRKDTDCGMSGNICDMATKTCRSGCRKDTDCGMGSICDTGTLSCRAGCRKNTDCPSEKICDATKNVCIAGCDGDAKCNSGRICEMSACVDGCRTSATCPVRQYCNTTTKKCTAGCNGDKTRCGEGEACVRLVDGNYRCDAQCYGWECNGTDWECYATYSDGSGTDYRNARCRKKCTTDASCGMSERCTVFTTKPSNPGWYKVNYCASSCASAGCSSALDGYAMSGMCTCAMDGACKTSMGTGYVCYQASPSYGL